MCNEFLRGFFESEVGKTTSETDNVYIGKVVLRPMYQGYQGITVVAEIGIIMLR